MNGISYLCHLFLFVSVVISDDDSNGRSFFFLQSKGVGRATATNFFVKSLFMRQMKDNHKTKLTIKMKLGLEI